MILDRTLSENLSACHVIFTEIFRVKITNASLSGHFKYIFASDLNWRPEEYNNECHIRKYIIWLSTFCLTAGVVGGATRARACRVVLWQLAHMLVQHTSAVVCTTTNYFNQQRVTAQFLFYHEYEKIHFSEPSDNELPCLIFMFSKGILMRNIHRNWCENRPTLRQNSYLMTSQQHNSHILILSEATELQGQDLIHLLSIGQWLLSVAKITPAVSWF